MGPGTNHDHGPRGQVLTPEWVKGRVVIEAPLSPEQTRVFLETVKIHLGGVRDLDPVLHRHRDPNGELARLKLSAPIVYLSPGKMDAALKHDQLERALKGMSAQDERRSELARIVGETRRLLDILHSSVNVCELGLIRGISLTATGEFTVTYAPTTPACFHRSTLKACIGEAVKEMFEVFKKAGVPVIDPGIKELPGQVWKKGDVAPHLRARTDNIAEMHRVMELTINGASAR